MICLRFDLDYVPWDSVNAEKYGHGEPAMVLKLLDFARQSGLKFHFFISNRALRTFPTTADAILGEGHELDWLTHYPDDPDLYEEAILLCKLAGHTIQGVAITAPWPKTLSPNWLLDLKFATGPKGQHPPRVVYFPETTRFKEDSLPFDSSSAHAIDYQILKDPEKLFVLVARPQVLAKRDPQLNGLQALLGGGVTIRTLREALEKQETTVEPEKG